VRLVQRQIDLRQGWESVIGRQSPHSADEGALAEDSDRHA
jgi:hypothetical protein